MPFFGKETRGTNGRPQDGPLESYHAHGDQLGLSCLFRWFRLVHHELLPDVVEICALLASEQNYINRRVVDVWKWFWFVFFGMFLKVKVKVSSYHQFIHPSTPPPNHHQSPFFLLKHFSPLYLTFSPPI